MKILIAAMALALLASPAAGEDVGTIDWAGTYVGGTIGYGWGESSVDSFGLVTVQEPSGSMAGLHVGYGHDLGGMLLGAEADLSFGGIRYVDTTFGMNIQSVPLMGTVRARAGLPLDRVMPYVTGGVAIATGRYELAPLDIDMSATHFGWVFGGGAELALTDMISIRAEYLHTWLNAATYTHDLVLPSDTTFQFGTMRAGLSYRF